MILRRFMKHVTDQNWFAVGLDVIVVVVGIFLGLQVTEWNDQRKEGNMRLEYLERYKNDLEVDHLEILSSSITAKMHLDTVKLLENVAKNPELALNDPKKFLQAISFNNSTRIFVPMRVTFNELNNSGRLDILNNPELELLIQKYYNMIELRSQWNVAASQITMKTKEYGAGLLDVEQRLMAFSFPGNNTEVPAFNLSDEEVLAVAGRLAANKDYINWLPNMADFQISTLRELWIINRGTETLLLQIYKVLGQPEELPEYKQRDNFRRPVLAES